MMTTAERIWDDFTLAERAAARLAAAADLDHCRQADGCSFDPARMAAAERREAAAELAEADEDDAALGHLARD